MTINSYMRPTCLEMTFGDRPLRFDILDTPVADLWIDRMNLRHRWPLDDPSRFYGFNDLETEIKIAEDMIKRCTATINQHAYIIEKEFTSVHDQDLMNYLHNIFERYHGMLDQQDHDFWHNAPDHVRKALANLNIAVHRCESLRHRRPRLVCTWFGMPKTQTLPLDLQEKYGRLDCDFGGVYLNYVEIGKTAFEMMLDDDQYMADEMFKPFNFFSADFYITFYKQSVKEMQPLVEKIGRYVEDNKEFFSRFGISDPNDVRIRPLRHKVAQLNFESLTQSAILDLIKQNQTVTKVDLL